MGYVYPTVQKVLGLPEGIRSQIRCPSGAHRDTIPSLTLYPDGSFYCFGCSRSGTNGLAFLINVLGNSVPESMEYLNSMKLLTKID